MRPGSTGEHARVYWKGVRGLAWIPFVLLLLPGVARANLNLFAGSNIGSHECGLADIELTQPLIAEVGPFLGWSRNTALGSENRYLAGLVGRITTPWLNFFIDTRLAYGWNSTAAPRPDDSGFNFEAGLGYRFTFTALDLIPRFGWNAVTANSDLPSFNLSIGVALPL